MSSFKHQLTVLGYLKTLICPLHGQPPDIGIAGGQIAVKSCCAIFAGICNIEYQNKTMQNFRQTGSNRVFDVKFTALNN
jgi:hypothetical protein